MFNLALNVFIFSILIQVILSWVNPMSGGMNPAVSLVYTLNEPILSRARRLIKPIHGFDLSPIVAMVILQVLKMIVVMPIADIAARMM
jgi:YggT family protein